MMPREKDDRDVKNSGKNLGNNIIDILDTPDVAVWAKGIRKGVNVPSDKVKEPSKITSTSPLQVNAQLKNGEKKEDCGPTIDPADKRDVGRAFAAKVSLTDES